MRADEVLRQISVTYLGPVCGQEIVASISPEGLVSVRTEVSFVGEVFHEQDVARR